MRAYRKYRKMTLQTWWERVLTNHPTVETTRKALVKIAYIEIKDFYLTKILYSKLDCWSGEAISNL